MSMPKLIMASCQVVNKNRKAGEGGVGLDVGVACHIDFNPLLRAAANKAGPLHFDGMSAYVQM